MKVEKNKEREGTGEIKKRVEEIGGKRKEGKGWGRGQKMTFLATFHCTQ